MRLGIGNTFLQRILFTDEPASLSNLMKDRGHFLKAMIKNPLAVGAIAPSSKELAHLMVLDLEPGPDAIVLELGVGTGAITSAIDGMLDDKSSYLGIEIDELLALLVQKKFPELNIVNADACCAAKVLKELDLGTVRYIISGIPFVSLPREICESIMNEIDSFMEKGCMFRTFQYVHGYYTPQAKRMRDRFTKRYGTMHKSPVILKNLPPAVVLTWTTH